MSLPSNTESSYNSGFKNDKNMNWAKSWKAPIWLERKIRISELSEFSILHYPKIENSEI